MLAVIDEGSELEVRCFQLLLGAIRTSGFERASDVVNKGVKMKKGLNVASDWNTLQVALGK